VARAFDDAGASGARYSGRCPASAVLPRFFGVFVVVAYVARSPELLAIVDAVRRRRARG